MIKKLWRLWIKDKSEGLALPQVPSNYAYFHTYTYTIHIYYITLICVGKLNNI